MRQIDLYDSLLADAADWVDKDFNHSEAADLALAYRGDAVTLADGTVVANDERLAAKIVRLLPVWLAVAL